MCLAILFVFCLASSAYTDQFSHISPVSILNTFDSLGINVIGCSNNHIFDFGLNGIRSALYELNKKKIAFAGIGKNKKEAAKAGNITLNNISLVKYDKYSRQIWTTLWKSHFLLLSLCYVMLCYVLLCCVVLCCIIVLCCAMCVRVLSQWLVIM